VEIQRVIGRKRILPTGVEIFAKVGLRRGPGKGADYPGRTCECVDRRRVERILPLCIDRHCQLVMNKGTAQVSLKILPIVRKLLPRRELCRIQSIASEIEVEISAQFAGAGLGDNFDTAESGAAVLRCKRVRVDADFFDLIFRRYLASQKSVDHELNAA